MAASVELATVTTDDSQPGLLVVPSTLRKLSTMLRLLLRSVLHVELLYGLFSLYLIPMSMTGLPETEPALATRVVIAVV